MIELGHIVGLLPWKFERLTQPVDAHRLVVGKLSSVFEEHGTNKVGLVINRSTAEHISGPQRQRNMLQNTGQKFETFNVTQKIMLIELTEIYKNVQEIR